MNDPLLLLCYMSILFAANVLGAVGGFGAGMISIPSHGISATTRGT